MCEPKSISNLSNVIVIVHVSVVLKTTVVGD